MRLKTHTMMVCLAVCTILMPSAAFGWGNHTHPTIGYAATSWAGRYPNANNGPDLCNLLQDAGFAHGDVKFADTMVELATQVNTPLLQQQWLQLAYGWGSHMMADQVAHQDMLVGFSNIEHLIAELGIDWWLYHNGSADEQQYARRASITWSAELVSRASEVYRERHQAGRILQPDEVNQAGERYVNLIAAEKVVMLLPNFYEHATDFSDNTSMLLSSPSVWRVYYGDAVAEVLQWLAASADIATVVPSEPAIAEASLLMAIGERAIALGGIQRLVSTDGDVRQVTLQVTDPVMCKRALGEVLSAHDSNASTDRQTLVGLLSRVTRMAAADHTPPIWGKIKEQTR